MTIKDFSALVDSPPTEHATLIGIATGFATVLDNVRLEKLENNPQVIIEGALTAIAIIAQRYNLQNQTADLMENWAADLRTGTPVLMKVEGQA